MSNLVTSFFYLLHHMRLCTAPYRFQIRCRLKGNALISYYVGGKIKYGLDGYLCLPCVITKNINAIGKHVLVVLSPWNFKYALQYENAIFSQCVYLLIFSFQNPFSSARPDLLEIVNCQSVVTRQGLPSGR